MGSRSNRMSERAAMAVFWIYYVVIVAVILDFGIRGP